VRLVLGIAIVFLLVPFCSYARRHSVDKIYNNPRDWVSKRLTADRQYANFAWRFRERDSVVISWPGCTIDDPRLERFAAEIEASPNSVRRADCERFFNQVLTGARMVDGLTAPPLALSHQDAAERLRGVVVGPDGYTSCAVVRLLGEGAEQREESVNLLLKIAEETCGLKRDQFVLGGAPIDGLAIDYQSRIAAGKYAIPSNLLVLVLCLFCLRSWRLTVIVYGLGTFGQLATIGLVYWSGLQLNAIFLVMPPLLLVLTVSAGVHLVNYYHDEARRAIDEPGQGGSVARRAIAKGWLPCLMAAATTVIGLVSLLAGESPPIAQFGAISAIAIVATVTLLFLMLPGAMEFWCKGRTRDSSPGRLGRWLDACIDTFANLVIRFRHVVIFLCLASMAVSGYGLTQMQISVSIRSLFSADSPIVQRYRVLEESIGPLVPIETVIRIRKRDDVPVIETIRLVRELHDAIADIDEVGGVVSAATFLPDLPDKPVESITKAGFSLSDAAKFRSRIQEMQFVDETRQAQYWRITARVSALDDIDYGEFLDQVAGRVEPVLARARQQFGTPALTASYTGPMPLTYMAQRSLLLDLLKSFLTALVLIAVMMMIYLRTFRGGLVVMLPNLFPTVLLFGLACLWGVAINIGSVMTASVALGIAVDDTLHFVTWFRRELTATGSRDLAVRRAYRHCAKAMVQSTLICGLGLMVYTLSPFVPTQRFAVMMLTLLLAALVGDLMLLPALLIGPLGNWLKEPVGDVSHLGHVSWVAETAKPQPAACGLAD
jgi:hypothetical protein